jgi:hypothetical protein
MMIYFVYGGLGGYNLDFRNWVLGLEIGKLGTFYFWSYPVGLPLHVIGITLI